MWTLTCCHLGRIMRSMKFGRSAVTDHGRPPSFWHMLIDRHRHSTPGRRECLRGLGSVRE